MIPQKPVPFIDPTTEWLNGAIAPFFSAPPEDINAS
jgi:hypothetical protein